MKIRATFRGITVDADVCKDCEDDSINFNGEYFVRIHKRCNVFVVAHVIKKSTFLPFEQNEFTYEEIKE